MFWNSQGYKHLYSFLDEINSPFEILCLCETWLLHPVDLPFTLKNNYNIHFCPAIKERSHGRAKGGLAIIYKNYYKMLVLDTSPWWIICLLSHKKLTFGICFVYFNLPDKYYLL